MTFDADIIVVEAEPADLPAANNNGAGPYIS